MDVLEAGFEITQKGVLDSAASLASLGKTESIIDALLSAADKMEVAKAVYEKVLPAEGGLIGIAVGLMGKAGKIISKSKKIIDELSNEKWKTDPAAQVRIFSAVYSIISSTMAYMAGAAVTKGFDEGSVLKMTRLMKSVQDILNAARSAAEFSQVIPRWGGIINKLLDMMKKKQLTKKKIDAEENKSAVGEEVESAAKIASDNKLEEDRARAEEDAYNAALEKSMANEAAYRAAAEKAEKEAQAARRAAREAEGEELSRYHEMEASRRDNEAKANREAEEKAAAEAAAYKAEAEKAAAQALSFKAAADKAAAEAEEKTEEKEKIGSPSVFDQIFRTVTYSVFENAEETEAEAKARLEEPKVIDGYAKKVVRLLSGIYVAVRAGDKLATKVESLMNTIASKRAQPDSNDDDPDDDDEEDKSKKDPKKETPWWDLSNEDGEIWFPTELNWLTIAGAGFVYLTPRPKKPSKTKVKISVGKQGNLVSLEFEGNIEEEALRTTSYKLAKSANDNELKRRLLESASAVAKANADALDLAARMAKSSAQLTVTVVDVLGNKFVSSTKVDGKKTAQLAMDILNAVTKTSEILTIFEEGKRDPLISEAKELASEAKELIEQWASSNDWTVYSDRSMGRGGYSEGRSYGRSSYNERRSSFDARTEDSQPRRAPRQIVPVISGYVDPIVGKKRVNDWVAALDSETPIAYIKRLVNEIYSELDGTIIDVGDECQANIFNVCALVNEIYMSLRPTRKNVDKLSPAEMVKVRINHDLACRGLKTPVVPDINTMSQLLDMLLITIM